MSVQRYFHNKDEDIILRYPIHPIPHKAVPPVHTNENTLGQTLNNISKDVKTVSQLKKVNVCGTLKHVWPYTEKQQSLCSDFERLAHVQCSDCIEVVCSFSFCTGETEMHVGWCVGASLEIKRVGSSKLTNMRHFFFLDLGLHSVDNTKWGFNVCILWSFLFLYQDTGVINNTGQGNASLSGYINEHCVK